MWIVFALTGQSFRDVDEQGQVTISPHAWWVVKHKEYKLSRNICVDFLSSFFLRFRYDLRATV